MPTQIDPNGTINELIYNPWIPSEPPKIISKKIPSEYEKDTIQKAKNSKDSWDFLFASGAFLPQQNTISVSKDARPKLEAPSVDIKSFKMAEEEIARLVAPIGQSENAEKAEQNFQASSQEKLENAHGMQQKGPAIDKNLVDIMLLQLLIQCLKVQRDQNETDVELTLHAVQLTQEINRKIKDEYLSQLNDHNEKNKLSSLLSWINGILYGILGVIGLASVGLTIASSAARDGLSLPLALSLTIAIANAMLSVASGTTTIANGLLKYKNKQVLAKLEEMKYEMNFNTQDIRRGMEEMQKSVDVITDNWRETAKVLTNYLEAASNR